MESNVSVANAPTFDMGRAVTRSLLGYGVLSGVFYLTVGLLQALIRDGFDLMRHPLSVLANGTGGWIQTTNFVLSGAMVIAAAVGFRRALGGKSRAVPLFLAGFGASMILAAGFPADPVDGFPVGTSLGPPTTISTTGMVHFIAGTLGFVSLAVSALAAFAMWRRDTRPLARLSLAAGICVLLGFFGGAALSGITSLGTLGIWFSVVVGWAWLAVASVHLYRLTPSPNCDSDAIGTHPG